MFSLEMKLRPVFTVVLALCLNALAQKDSDPPSKVTPLILWDFEQNKPGSPAGNPTLSQSTLISPEYPGFPVKNTSLQLNGSSSWKLPDDPSLRFTNGDSLTIETWVRLDSLRNGGFTYLIGKGRNKNKALTPENQNWALRLKGDHGTALPTFLFRSAGPKSNYHRWTASEGFADDGDWHHLALSYTFGKPKSIVAFIDGIRIQQGTWDMGGPTKNPPVTDADHLTIGTGNGGSSSNSLHGSLDNLAVYREIVPEKILLSRYLHLAPPSGLDPALIPSDSVLIEIATSGIPSGKAWPKKQPVASEKFIRSHFAFPAIPHHYVATGVRGQRKAPFLLRASSKITLPAGTNRILLRGRNSARLLIDGKKIIQTSFTPPSEGALGFTSDQDDFLTPGDPDFRFVTPGNEETLATFTTPGGEHLISMQQLIGSAGNRPEPGEFVAAISLQNSSDWHLLTPSKNKIPYTDQHFPSFEKDHLAWVEKTNTARRSALRKKHSPYWQKRRQATRDHITKTTPVPIPKTSKTLPAHDSIDHFLNARIETVATQLKDYQPDHLDFYQTILPILENRCFSCHQGKKTKGGLDLSSPASALEGGEFDGPAITPGDLKNSDLIHRITSDDPDEKMPPKGDPVTPEELALLKKWITQGATWPELNIDRIHLTEISDDLTFLRRLSLDTIGVPPTLTEIATFQNDPEKSKRARAIDRFLADPRWADRWMGYFQDILGENPTALQPAIISNGTVDIWLTRLSDDQALTRLALEDQPADELLNKLFLRLLTRKPTSSEKETYLAHLIPQYDLRRPNTLPPSPEKKTRPPQYVSWYNHLDPVADNIRRQEIKAARTGAPPTQQLTPEWRQRLEDLIWSVINSPEFIHTR